MPIRLSYWAIGPQGGSRTHKDVTRFECRRRFQLGHLGIYLCHGLDSNQHYSVTQTDASCHWATVTCLSLLGEELPLIRVR